MNSLPGTWLRRAKHFFLGGAKDPADSRVFHSLSLIPFLAWVGLGSDGLSSSCYGPEEAFRALGNHMYLSIFVALASGITIFIISQSYKQIIQLFPAGGGGYLVATKLLNPKIGMVSGCALLIDYILTISISVASGAAAIFSFLPQAWQPYKVVFAASGLVLLIIANLRGIREAVIPLVPVFLLFVLLHLFAIMYTLLTHMLQIGTVSARAATEFSNTYNSLGFFGVIFLILKSFSMGAGTYTGIEAVSNGLPVLRDPKVQTAQKTMNYMAVSLAITVVGLMLSYLLYAVTPSEGKTLNAVLFEKMAQSWPAAWASAFVFATLLTEAVLLFIAAQTGFLDGPRVLASMAIDRWFPSRFAHLSDRLVAKNGILLMGVSAFVMLLISGGAVSFLVVLYSINVFITFTLSQIGMVRHWWQVRGQDSRWKHGLAINGIGMVITLFILISVIVIKFGEGGWVTLAVTGMLVTLAVYINAHYTRTGKLLRRLDAIIDSVEASIYAVPAGGTLGGGEVHAVPLRRNKTAVFLVNGFNGLGVHTLFSSMRLFSGVFDHFIFLNIGAVDAGTFKGADEIRQLELHIRHETMRYVEYMRSQGFSAECVTGIATDVLEGIVSQGIKLREKYRNLVFFGGQLVFHDESVFTRFLHNYVVFAAQRKFYYEGLPFIIMPIRL